MFCNVCGQELTEESLISGDLIVDAQSADAEYRLAQEYFANSDFREAGNRFKKVLTYHKNHYLAEYFSALCDVYENEEKTDFNVGGQIFSGILKSIEKLGLCQVNINGRIEFLTVIFSQSHIILSSYFNRIYDKYEKTEMWDILRDKCVDIAVAAKDLFVLDKELLMTFDKGIAKYLISIADLAICACRKAVAPHLISDKILDLPTDYQYEKVKSCYGVIMYSASEIDSDYGSDEYKPDYTANLLYSKKVADELNKYNVENQSLNKRCLSTLGELLNSFKKDALTAVKYSYHTCFKSLSNCKTEQARIALINDSVSFCFELLMPRIYIDSDKKINVSVNSYTQAIDIYSYLNDFLRDFHEYNAKIAADCVVKFFERVYETVKTHFNSVVNAYEKSLDKIKDAHDSEYRYYKNFLHNIIYSCSVALKEMMYYDSHPMSERLKVLKLGKQACEEFLMLNDYKVEELAQSVKYSDMLDIYNELDNSIEEFSVKR